MVFLVGLKQKYIFYRKCEQTFQSCITDDDDDFAAVFFAKAELVMNWRCRQEVFFEGVRGVVKLELF